MEALPLTELARIVGGDLRASTGDPVVASVAIDSRRLGSRAAFFALPGERTDGHRHVADALAAGAVCAVVARGGLDGEVAGPVVEVDSPLAALQALAGWWRGRLDARVVAITGSNGKTIAKDSLVHLLSGKYAVAGTLGSWNSQLGVPLSVLRLPATAEIAVLEAGVSRPGEMDALEAILRPDCGLLLNVGLAHIAGFGSRDAIALEKARLFRRLPADGWLLAPAGDERIDAALSPLGDRVRHLGEGDGALPWVERASVAGDEHRVTLAFPDGARRDVRLLTPSREIVTDVAAAAAAAYLLGLDADAVQAGLDGYAPTQTRMRIWRSTMRDVTVIDDAESADPVSVESALRCLANLGRPPGRRLFVFAGMRELGEYDESEHAAVGRLAGSHGVDHLVLTDGDRSATAATEHAYLEAGQGGSVTRCASADELREHLERQLRAGDVVLFKGPREAGVGQAARGLMEAMSPNRLLIDLEAIAENIHGFRRLVGPETRVLGMVKALSYGADLTRLGLELQRLGVDALGVATATEGALLRRAGVDLPILLTLVSPESAAEVVAHRLTPVVHAASLVQPLAAAAEAAGRRLAVHLELDTGMGRSGVFPQDGLEVARAIRDSGQLDLVGLMTHFASAELPEQDAATHLQIERFEACAARLGEDGFTALQRHAANTAGAVRFPGARYDMVRVGIGLYGVYPSAAVADAIELTPALSLLSRITGLRAFPKGSRLGYGGTYVVERDDFRGAVVPLGYHDAVPWASSNRGHVLVHGRRAPIVGRVSMDSTIVDVSDVAEAAEGSDVLVYGSHAGHTLRPEEVAAEAGTIAYELMARVGGVRIQRIYLG